MILIARSIAFETSVRYLSEVLFDKIAIINTYRDVVSNTNKKMALHTKHCLLALTVL